MSVTSAPISTLSQKLTPEHLQKNHQSSTSQGLVFSVAKSSGSGLVREANIHENNMQSIQSTTEKEIVSDVDFMFGISNGNFLSIDMNASNFILATDLVEKPALSFSLPPTSATRASLSDSAACNPLVPIEFTRMKRSTDFLSACLTPAVSTSATKETLREINSNLHSELFGDFNTFQANSEADGEDDSLDLESLVPSPDDEQHERGGLDQDQESGNDGQINHSHSEPSSIEGPKKRYRSID